MARPLTSSTFDAVVSGVVPTSGCDEVDAVASTGEQRRGDVVVDVIISHERFSGDELLVAEFVTISDAAVPATSCGLWHPTGCQSTVSADACNSASVSHD